MNPVDLGTPLSKPEPCCAPSYSLDGKCYPSTYITIPEGAKLEIPDSGEITFRFRVCRETDDKKDGTCRYEMDLTQIVGVKADPGSEEDDDSAGERISKAFAGKKKD